jgi:hypothetical protein
MKVHVMRNLQLRPALCGVLLGGALALSTSCGGGGGPTGPSASTDIQFLVAIAVSAGGSFSATLNNQTYTSAPGFQTALPAGVHEISGTYTGGTLIVGFASTSIGAAGVQSGSVQSVSGVVLGVQPCGAAYSEGPGTRSFRMRFTVGTNANSTCR